MDEERKLSVLCAAVPALDETLRDCLPGHELTFVRTMHQAVSALRRDGFRLVIIDLNFDESRMFELLQYLRALPKYAGVPVICTYGEPLNLSGAVIRNIDVAVKALGGLAFLDLRDGSLAHHADCHRLGAIAAHAGNASRH